MYQLILVDDEPNTCEILTDFIREEKIGYEVVASFYDGKQAWDFLKENSVDCVITDIKMPHMDGLELAKKIYQNQLSTRVVLLSGYREFEYAQQGIQYGVVDYQLKPIDYDKLLEVLVKIRKQLEDYPEKARKNKSTPEKGESAKDFNTVAMESALRYLQEHYNEPISRESVADVCFMNSAYFGRCFKQYTGHTFTEYLTNLRIENSIRLLGKNIPIDEIASKVGYGSSRHFGRIFKEVTGYTPTEYRINILEQETGR